MPKGIPNNGLPNPGCFKPGPSPFKGQKRTGNFHGNPTHGHTRGKRSPTYKSWETAKARCHNPNNDNFKYYGGRGIVMCERWRNSFEAFLADMGERPSGMTIDRKDTNGNYDPDNCKWSNPVEQIAGRRNAKLIEWNGEKRTAVQWSLHFGWPKHTIKARMDNGFTVERAMTTPLCMWKRNRERYKNAKVAGAS